MRIINLDMVEFTIDAKSVKNYLHDVKIQIEELSIIRFVG
ncbi:Uncharacterised protein [Chryseobacterium indoltheticum]|uniref:Uncharacterized protein n=1 Tax=Chryseobacterium indoltheticum TaxID=254 RepID=A0A381FR99_9FLAO|nr:Uncharacterised protein [Chryseobacterium indoltheticum]